MKTCSNCSATLEVNTVKIAEVEDEDTAEDIMQPVFEAIGLVQAFTHDHRGEVQS